MYVPQESELLPAYPLIEPLPRPRLALGVSWLVITGLLFLVTLTSCTSVMHVKGGPPLRSGVTWVLLPFGDFGETPQAGERAEELATALLRVRWNLDLDRYPPTKESAALVDLDERQRYDQALKWAREQGYIYGLTGSVQEWRYRNGSEGEAAVGLSLRVVNIKSGRPDWLATGSRSGFGAQTVSGVAERLLGKMIDQLRIK
jgi:hypothetical protein